MALPKLQVPTFSLKLPSTKQEITYRPFLVKEEKVLLMAMEGDDPKETSRAIRQIISNCCITKIDVDSLTPFDIEYIFIQLRGKSVGERISLQRKCQKEECGASINFEINTDDIVVTEYPGHSTKVELADNIGIVMKYPTLDDVADLSSKEKAGDALFVVAACIDYIYDQSQVYKSKDFSQEELIEWIEQLSQSQIVKIKEFLETTPKVTYITDIKCGKCKTKNHIEIAGLQNFFG